MLYKENKLIEDINMGGQPIAYVYHGDELVYQKGDILRPMILEYTVNEGGFAYLPIYDVVSCSIDWGDGSSEIVTWGHSFHTYKNGGVYKVSILGKFGALYSRGISLSTLTSVLSWGSGQGLTSLAWGFYFATSLTHIPDDEFGAFRKVTDFSYCFHLCTAIKTIPAGLFAKSIRARTFLWCFVNCSSLESIPATLFENNRTVTNFNSCFFACHSLKEIPEKLFQNNKAVENFSVCFSGCTSLTGKTPKDPDGGELWERANKAGYPDRIWGERCFSGCTGLTNYNEIPDNWVN